MTDTSRYTVDATETSLAVLETLVASEDPLGVTAVAETVGVSKGVAHNHLSTLCTNGYVTKNDGTYSPSLQLLSMGSRTRDRHAIYEAAKHQVNNLATATGETATLFVNENGEGVPIHIAETPDGWSPPFHEGSRIPLHLTAPGKAILSSLPEENANTILETHDLVSSTDATMTDRSELVSQLQRIRDDGISFCREEHYEGIIGVAAPISTATDTLTAAIGVCGPATRLNGRFLEEDITGQVLSTTKSVYVNLA
ncbi:IclR family transcriptional regulator [Natronococcus sp. A-GB1]|uniref:IclR family transcriptional regulator n=1 Tax=Natronococcus sp. A-GB1 TaxID=3037648 RepID=UPI00241EA073|nr:IclR family transcriptional regulator [Natronococcus sp. A-GB1]MDG5761948.1 IclR family transcriptional regulator [Natronococcus sp. A-GB1]